MAITINDVAREAGVSITTVSRVLNNNYPVKIETREKIEKAIEKLNYKPNAAARSLITKKTANIAIVVPGITNLFFPTIVETIQESIKDRGYNILLSSTGGDYKEEKNVIEDVLSKLVDGIIVIDPSIENLSNGYLEEMTKNIPLIVVNGAPNGYKCNFVSYDEEVGTKEAFEYLLALGHKKIAFIRGQKSFSYDIKEKIYKEFIKKNNLKYENIINVGKGNSIEVVQNTQKEIEKLMNGDSRPTSVFACNDLMAVGAINSCNSLKINIPSEVSIIGCDNTLLSSIAHPALTSVDLNMKDIGYRAAVELIDLIENSTKTRKKVILDTSLVVRESCGRI